MESRRLKYITIWMLIISLFIPVTACSNFMDRESEATKDSSKKRSIRSGKRDKDRDRDEEEKELKKDDEEPVKVKPLNYLMYIKDSAVYYDKLDGSEPIRLYDVIDGYWSDMYIEAGSEITKNQNRLIYIKGLSSEQNVGTLCYRDIDKDGNMSEETVVSEQASSFVSDANGDIILYLIDDDVTYGTVYEYNTKTKENVKIAEDSYYFKISDDAERILYVNKDDMICERTTADKKDTEIARGVFERGSFDDLKNYYYIDEENNLYIKEFSKKAKLIDVNVEQISKVYKDGEIYYEKLEDVRATMSTDDFINDDMREADLSGLDNIPEYIKNMKEPIYDDYDNDEDYGQALDAYWEHEEQRQEFNKINIREKYRRDIEEDSKATVRRYSLYYFDTKESNKVGDWTTAAYNHWDDYERAFNYDINEDVPMVLFSEFDDASTNMINMSAIPIINFEEYSLAETAMMMNYRTKIAIGDKVLDVKLPKDDKPAISNMRFSKDNKSIYVFKSEDYISYNKTNLYQGKIHDKENTDNKTDGYHERVENKDQISCDLLAENVVDYIFHTTSNGDAYYQTVSEDEEHYSLWRNSELLYDDFYIESISDNERYISIHRYEDEDGTGGRTIVLADGRELVIDENSIAYIYFDKNNNIIFTKPIPAETEEYKEDIYIYDEESRAKLIAGNANLLNIDLTAEDFVD